MSNACRTRQVGAQLTGGVVQHELVVAVASKLFALDAAECGGVGLAFAAFVVAPGAAPCQAGLCPRCRC